MIMGQYRRLSRARKSHETKDELKLTDKHASSWASENRYLMYITTQYTAKACTCNCTDLILRKWLCQLYPYCILPCIFSVKSAFPIIYVCISPQLSACLKYYYLVSQVRREASHSNNCIFIQSPMLSWLVQFML